MILLYTDERNSGLEPEFFKKIAYEVVSCVGNPPDENCEVSLLITDDEEIRDLNRSYRKIDRPTDVLSFPMGDGPMLGDIAISLDTAKRQAKEAGVSLEREAAFLFIHGLLHLIGYDHETCPEDEAQMFALQENILKKLIADGYVS